MCVCLCVCARVCVSSQADHLRHQSDGECSMAVTEPLCSPRPLITVIRSSEAGAEKRGRGTERGRERGSGEEEGEGEGQREREKGRGRKGEDVGVGVEVRGTPSHHA